MRPPIALFSLLTLLIGMVLSGTAARAGTLADGLSTVGDFRGTGKQQIAALWDPSADLGLRISVLDGAGETFTKSDWFTSGAGAFDLARMKVVASDVDRDRRDDLVVLYDDGGTSVRLLVFRSTGSAFTYAGEWYRNDGYAFARVAAMVSGNFSGSNTPGLLLAYQYDGWQMRMHYFETTGSSFYYAGNAGVYDSGPGQYDTARARFAVGRFTRAGGPDQIASVYQYPNQRIRVHVFDPTPRGLEPVNGWSGVYESGDGAFDLDRAQIVAADADGDGLSDLVALYLYDDGGVRAFTFPGARSLAVRSNPPLAAIHPGQQPWRGTRVVGGDWDGDKKGDLAALTGLIEGVARVSLLRSSGTALGFAPFAYVTPAAEARTAACTRCWALSGMPLGADPGTRRPIAVKIDNAPAARPQVGHGRADMVVELLAEGNTTRYEAIYHSRDPELVGPVRSARFGDRYLLPMLRGALAYSGASTAITALLRLDAAEGRYLDLDANLWPMYFRDTSRPAPNNLFTYGERLRGAVNELDRGVAAVAVPHWRFFAGAHQPRDGGFASAVTATTLTIPYRADRAEVRYDYLGAAGYARFQNDNGRPVRAVDAADGSFVNAASVVVIQAETFDSGLRDSSDAVVLDMRMVGSGPVSVFRDGLRVDGVWSRGSLFEGFQITTKGGEPILLKAGQTWVQIIPLDWSVPSR
ncbi:MAG: DUF3048 domain-containing protein [Chloroflexi bacterium]|nr:DUF3048 domain-containing protein [Chloroflexota bacterium]